MYCGMIYCVSKRRMKKNHRHFRYTLYHCLLVRVTRIINPLKEKTMATEDSHIQNTFSPLMMIENTLYSDWGMDSLPDIPDGRTNFATAKFAKTKHTSKSDEYVADNDYSLVLGEDQNGDIVTVGTWFIVSGGQDQHGDVLSSILILDTSDPDAEWKEFGTMPESLMHHAMCVVGEKLYISGGFSYQGEYLPRSSILYLHIKDKAQEPTYLTDMPDGRYKHIMNNHDGVLIVANGHGGIYPDPAPIFFLDTSAENPEWVWDRDNLKLPLPKMPTVMFTPPGVEES